MRRLPALIVAVFALLSPPLYGAEEPQDMGGLYGTLAFDENLNETLNLSMGFQWILLDGRNVSAQEIRDAYGTDGWNFLYSDIEKAGREIFNRTLWILESHGTHVEVSIGNIWGEGPLHLYMNGSGIMNYSSDDPELFASILDCGLNITLSPEPENISLNIIAPRGWKINGERSYMWDGESTEIRIEGPEPRKNRIDVLMDIYHMDTSGERQKLKMNLSVDASVYSVPFNGNVSLPEGLNISHPTIRLINLMVERSLLDEDELERRMDSYLDRMEERIVDRFPDVDVVERYMNNTGDSLKIRVSAMVSAPLDAFTNGAFLRWYASQRIVLQLSGMDASIVNYTVMIPEGMKILSMDHGKIPVFYRDFGNRTGFIASVSDSGTYMVGISIGFVIDLNPLIPLFVGVAVAFILWALVTRYVPKRRGRHG